MTKALLASSYVFNEELGIWARPGFIGINYSDGKEIEQRIASAINKSSDISVLSSELRQYCTDWPSLYHLSSTRANILRPFESMLKGDILEVGAGCGAITRYLGEVGANVLALEGTPRRAAIARSRTRDLENVTVLAEKFDEFQCDQQFDVITLIGVLEYANLFTSGENPPLTMLERVRALLKPNGKLIIAIENQLGLKYFAGAPEDHLGVPLYGVEGQYRKDQPQTYGRKVLGALIGKAGFASLDFLAPFPDYKLPVSIVTERGFLCEEFDAAALAVQSVRLDPQLPSILAFSPELVWPTIVNNDLASDLSNSFLIIASQTENEVLVSSDTLAWHFTTGRRKELCKVTEFVEIKNKAIEVRYRRLDPSAPNPVVGRYLQNYLPDQDKYITGNSLLHYLKLVLTRDDWSIDDISNRLVELLKLLAEFAAKQGCVIDISNPFSKLQGEFFDYLPQNIYLSREGDFYGIDKEWVSNQELEIGYLIFRSLLTIPFTTVRFGRPKSDKVTTPYDLISSAMIALGWSISSHDISRWLKVECRIQSDVEGRPVPYETVMERLKGYALPSLNLSKAVGDRDRQIADLNQALADRDKQIANLSQAATDRDSQITNLEKLVSGFDNQIIEILNSNSWRITAPLRWLSFRFKNTRINQEIKGYLREIANVINLSKKIPGFDPEMYLELNPDVKKSKMSAHRHYILYGQKEGRVWNLDRINLEVCSDSPDREWIMIVSHDASLTGAPVLAWNLANDLINTYNVCVLLLRGGPLVDSFIQTGAHTLALDAGQAHQSVLNYIIHKLCQRIQFKYSIVNSIESRVVLDALSGEFIPTISLIHEFPSFLRNKGAFVEAGLLSSVVVFPSKIVEKNVSETDVYLGRELRSKVLSQGRCKIPKGIDHSSENIADQTLCKRIIPGRITVLGVGYVFMRKGVDLFVTIAQSIVEMGYGGEYQFIWVGDGYEPDSNDGYSRYLADQITRAKLENIVTILPATSQLDKIYDIADIFILTSRLDPQPNVAIDAFYHGLPLICFDQTTGVVDFLDEIGLRDQCVAKYLDVTDLCSKLIRLGESNRLRSEVGLLLREKSAGRFSFNTYVDRIDTIAKEACVLTQQERLDTEVIADSGLLDTRFCFGSEATRFDSIQVAARFFVRTWAAGISRFKPTVGFSPAEYQQENCLLATGVNPLAHYIRSGYPEGPWNHQIIRSKSHIANDVPVKSKVALHIHAYYPDLFDEIVSAIEYNVTRPDLFISTPNDEVEEYVLERLRFYSGGVQRVVQVPNLGRDIGPFLTEFSAELLDYQAIGHIHTKKTHHKESNLIRRWFDFLVKHLLGDGDNKMMDQIIQALVCDQKLGIIIPEDRHIIGWNGNLQDAERLCEKISIQNLPRDPVFPLGSMFWARPHALKPLFDLGLDWDDYPKEPVPEDGTILHAIERLFVICAQSQGYSYAATHVPNVNW
jgi:glycosyltransferase involved in cell wall biosynthesis/2-polyprenyl-3-methyl-5-hydroxy-6-metoxy-1,4-benzoquinol methylase